MVSSRPELLVDTPRVLPVDVAGVAARGVLEVAHRLKGPGVVLAALAEQVVAADREGILQNRRGTEGLAVARGRFRCDLRQAGTLDGGGGAGEIMLDESARQTDGVEDLGAAIRLIGRDAHLGHHLEDALVDRLDVALDRFLLADLLGEVAAHGVEGFESEIGIDRFGAVAGEHREMVHLARFAGLDHQADRGPEAGADQVMVDAGGGEQRRDRDAVGSDPAVGEDDDVDAVVDRGRGGRAECFQRAGHAVGAGRGRVGDVQRGRMKMVVVEVADRTDLLQVLVGEDRLAHLEALAGAVAVEVEQVRPRADERHQAHDQFLADRVDRRVGDLGEVLLEIGVEQPRLVGEHRDRRVVAHGADRFLACHRHRRHQEVQVFLGVAERLLAIEQADRGRRRVAVDLGQVLQHDLGARQPLGVGMAAGEIGLDLVVGDDAALFEVDQQHLARLQAPLGDDPRFLDGQHTRLGGHDHLVVGGDHVARRPQAVAVEGGADPDAVGEGDRGRAVPRLHQRGAVFVEGAPLLVHQRVAGPRFRDQHHRGVGQRVAAAQEELQRVVEAGGVGLALVGDRPQLGDVVAVEVGRGARLARRHPVDVAAHGVDFAIVADQPVRVGEPPGREGVGREALVNKGQRRLETRIVKVAVVGAELVGEEHALVDDRAA